MELLELENVFTLDSLPKENKIMSIIYTLKSQGLVTNILGSIPQIVRPAFAVWARKEPKNPFQAFIALSRVISSEPLTVFVDDLCSQLVMKRSRIEQIKINELYSNYFNDSGCVVYFSSELYGNIFDAEIFPLFLESGRRVSVNEFKRCLPESKRRALNNLTLDEILHLLLELSLLEKVAKKCNLLLVGHFSQAIIVCHRKTSNNPISGIAIPKLNNVEEINEYKQKLQNTNGRFL